MREGKSETKDIVIMDSFLIFEALLMYLYTSTLVCDSFNVDQLVELLLLADRYLLLHLKSLCEKKLKGFVTTKTVMHLYDVSLSLALLISLDRREIKSRSVEAGLCQIHCKVFGCL